MQRHLEEAEWEAIRILAGKGDDYGDEKSPSWNMMTICTVGGVLFFNVITRQVLLPRRGFEALGSTLHPTSRTPSMSLGSRSHQKMHSGIVTRAWWRMWIASHFVGNVLAEGTKSPKKCCLETVGHPEETPSRSIHPARRKACATKQNK